jgi:hypothetical protein
MPVPFMIENHHKYPGQITPVPRRGGTADNFRRGGNGYLEDGTFIRLQTVRLNYQIPEKLSKKAFMSSLSIYAYSNNLATWTNYTGFDPEVGQRSILTPGNDGGRFPRRREFGFGINSSF